MEIAIIGAGLYGTSIAKLLFDKGHNVKVWAFNNVKREDMPLPEQIVVTGDIDEVVNFSKTIIIALNSPFVVETLKTFPKKDYNDHILISTTKGFILTEHEFITPLEAIRQTLGISTYANLVGISGPNIGKEIYEAKACATVLACLNNETLEKVKPIFDIPGRFRIYTTTDITGVQFCGALKNVLAIGYGIIDELGYGENFKATFMSRSIMELIRFGKIYKTHISTFFSPAGFGDLISTCLKGRNAFAGRMFAQGKSIEEVSKEVYPMVLEGPSAVKTIYEVAELRNIDMPITKMVHKVIYEDVTTEDAVKELLGRPLVDVEEEFKSFLATS